MGNKDTGKREVKKKPQPKPKVAPGRKREDVNQTTTRINREGKEQA
jgi:hypothetical protein